VELPVALREVFEGATKEFSLRVQEPDGRIQTRNHKVRIPKGATDGTSLRVPSQDGGDLLLKLKVTADPVFQLDGHDLTAKVKVEAWKAALGGQVEVPTLAGPVSMKVPAGVQTGQKLRLKGKGLPRREGEMGDLFALVEISGPKALSEQERALYEELAKLAGGLSGG
jgi:curved DNA-binding protein